MVTSTYEHLGHSTIYGVMTPLGRAALAVLRLSGPESTNVLQKLTRQKAPAEAMLRPRKLYDPQSGQLLDEVMAVRFPSPRSYTGEDVVEMHLHGSPVLLQHVISLLPSLGAYAAEPGEFTLRAFLNGKKDLAQAEAVHDLVEARSVAAVSLAARGVSGQLSREVDTLSLALVDVLVGLEAEIDFPEDVPPSDRQELAALLDLNRKRALFLLEGYQKARLLKEGFRVVLAGPPNAGKSSLFNALLGRQRAIVTPEAGTTRDYLEEFLPGTTLPILLVDTAGLRNSESVAESVGVSLSQAQIAQANLVLALYNPLTGKPADEGFDPAAKLSVATHADLLAETVEGGEDAVGMSVSSKTGLGIDALRQRIVQIAQEALVGSGNSALVANARQAEALGCAVEALDEACAQCQVLPVDIIASLIRKVLSHLGSMKGENLSEHILNAIFSRFCIGK